MNKNLFLFTFLLVLLSAVTGWTVNHFAPASFQVWIIGFLTAATWCTYFLVSRASSHDSFLRNYLLSIVLKLLSGGIFIFIVIYLDKPAANANALLFMVGYLVFTGLEVIFLFNSRNKA